METKTQQIIHSRLGEKQINLDKVIVFPKGLVGFETSRRFILFRIRNDSPFLMLQDVDNSGIGLIVTDPYAFVPDYSLKVEDCDAEILGTSQLNEISVIVTVSIPHGQPEKTSLNLCGPILINTVKRVGIQAPQRDPAVRQPVLLRDL